MLLGALLGLVELNAVAALFPLASLVGAGALAYAAARLVDAYGDDARSLVAGRDLGRLWRLVD